MHGSSTYGVNFLLIVGLSLVNIIGALTFVAHKHPSALTALTNGALGTMSDRVTPPDGSNPAELNPTDSAALNAAAVPDAPVLVRIDEVFRPGDQRHEFVALVNPGPSLDVTGWTLSDAHGHRFTFPSFILFQGGGVNIHTRQGTDTPVRLYWDLTTPVWSAGETLTLRDADGTVHATFTVQDT